MYYNPKLFDEAGLEYPTNEWTYDEFLAACEALKTSMGKPPMGLMGSSNETTYHFWSRLVTEGGSIFDENMEKVTFNSEFGVQAVRSVIDLYEKGYIPASFAEATVDDPSFPAAPF